MDEDINPIERDVIEGLEIEVKDHLEKVNDDECAYCGQFFAPDEIVIEKTVFGRKMHFCSDECYQEYQETKNFKDEDLDAKEVPPPSSDEVYEEGDQEE